MISLQKLQRLFAKSTKVAGSPASNQKVKEKQVGLRARGWLCLVGIKDFSNLRSLLGLIINNFWPHSR